MPTGTTENLRVGSTFDVGPILAGMGLAVDSVEAGTARMNTRFNRLGTESEAAMNKVAFSSTEARHALHGLGEEVGVHIPRFVQTFVAHMGGVGPLLASAFSAIAIVGLIQILAQVPEAIDKIIGKLAGWDKEAQKTYADMVQGNRTLQIENLKLEDQMARIALIGKTGSERTAMEMELLGKSTQETAKLMADFMRARVRMEEEVHKMTPTDPRAVLGNEIIGWFKESDLDKKKKDIQELNKLIEQMEKTLRESAGKKAGAGAEDIEVRTKEAERYRDTLERIYDEETKLTQQTAEKELREFERLASARERLDEEMEKTTLDMAKKDLETFQHSIIDRLRLQEEEGRTELGRIRTVYEEEVAMLRIQRGEKALSLAEYTSDVMQAAQKEYQAQYDVLQKEIRAVQDAANKQIITEEEKVRRLAALHNEEARLFEQKQREMLNAQQQAARQQQQSIDQLANKWAQDFSRMTTEVLTGKQRIGTAVVQMMGQLELQMIERGIRKVVSKWGGEMLGLVTSHAAWLAKLLGIEVAGNAQQVAAGTVTATAEVGEKAAVAGASGFASVMEALPFPENIATAPGVMAAAVSATMSNLGLLAFERGGIMPSAGLAMLHPKEMILDPILSQHVMQTAGGGGGAGGNAHFTVHNHFAGTPSKQDVAALEDQMVAVLKRAARRGRFDDKTQIR
jgi:hypothetical protein